MFVCEIVGETSENETETLFYDEFNDEYQDENQEEKTSKYAHSLKFIILCIFIRCFL